MKHYNKHEIKKGWNYPLYRTVQELDLDSIAKECLHGIMKHGTIYLYKNNHGFPKSLEPQLGFTPNKVQIKQALATLRSKGYIEREFTKVEQKNRTEYTFVPNIYKIKGEPEPKKDTQTICNNPLF